MKIAINASILSKNSTGTGTAVINIIDNFKHKNNFDVYTSEVEAISTSYSIFDISLRKSPLNKKWSGLYRFFWNQYSLTKIGKKYDLVYCPTTHGSIFLTNQVITVLDLIVYQFPKIHRFQWIYYKLFLPIFLRRSKGIIVISDSVKADLIKNYPRLRPSKVTVIKCGYNDNLFNRNINPLLFELVKTKYNINKDYFIAVGATYAHKNIDVIINSIYERVRMGDVDFILVIAGGRTEYRILLEDLVVTKNLSSYVKFIGYVSNEELVALYQNSLGLIYSSLSEGFGLPLIEAMACGCPVIASEIDVLQEVGGDAVLYFDPLSTQSLNQAITELIGNPIHRDHLVSKGLTQITQFSWKKASDDIYSLFEDLT